MSLVFFDFEVFAHDWMVVFIQPSERAETVIVNDTEKFQAFYDEHKNDIWIGYNVRNYDQFIAKGILCGFNPKEVSDFIIDKGHNGWQFSNLFRKFPINIYDTMAGYRSLKELEAFMGNDIHETSVPFDINRKLTASEIAETIKYCRHDVEQTIEVFLNRYETFEAQMNIIKSFNMPISNISKTLAQLISVIMEARNKKYYDEFDISIPDTLKLSKYAFVRDWYADKSNRSYDKSLTVNIAGVPHTFKWGGVHGAIPEYVCNDGNFIMADVTSLYPSIMIQYGYFSRSMKNPQKYIDIFNENIRMKKTHDPRRPAYKLVCNTTAGCFKYKDSALYDPLQNNNICVTGQLLILDLIEKLEPLCKLIQSNTDGILIRVDNDNVEEIKGVISEWEKRTRLNMELSFYTRVYQRNVNNYIIVDKNGHAKTIGTYVKQLSKMDNDLAIVNKAINDYIINGINPKETVMKCDELIMFQKVVKITSSYKFAVWKGQKFTEKTFRVFASTRIQDGMIGKCKNKWSTVEKFANTPEKCFIMNGDINGVSIPDYLDKQYYVDLAVKRIRDFGVNYETKTRQYNLFET